MSPRFHRRAERRRLSDGYRRAKRRRPWNGYAILMVPVAVLALLSGAALGQSAPPPGQPPAAAIEPMQPPKDLPRPQKGDRTRNLDFLFGALKAAPDADSAKQVEARI